MRSVFRTGTGRMSAAFSGMAHVRSWLTSVGVATSHPLAFVIVGVFVAVWLIIDPRSFNWASAATVATWVMTLFIQRAEHRDTQAIHAKLDESLRSEGHARNELTTLDQHKLKKIEAQRKNEADRVARPTG